VKRVFQANEVPVFREQINYHHDTIIVVRHQKPFHKVQWNYLPCCSWCSQQLQQTRVFDTSTLACWQVGQLRTNWSTCFLRPGQANNCCNHLMVAGIPKCPLRGELWNVLINCCCSLELLPTQIRCLNQIRPSFRVKGDDGAVAEANFTNRSWACWSDWQPWIMSAHHWGVAIDKAQQTPSVWIRRERASAALFLTPFL
jgi:hypothetical protein